MEKKGYFSEAFNERHRLLSVDSNPNAAAIVACYSSKKDNRDILNLKRKIVHGTHLAARGEDLVHLVSSVCLVCLVRRTRETRQTRAPDRLAPVSPEKWGRLS
jgi:hypothetical protein